MKQFSKRVVAVILAVLMVLALSTAALAAAGNQEFDKNTAGTEKLITGYSANGTENGVLDLEAELKATERVDGKFVIVNYTFTGVKDNAFNRNSTDVNTATKEFLATVKELIVEDGVKDIGASAFANMPALEKVTFKGDAVLGEEAFAGCTKLAEVVFAKDAVVGTGAFNGCTALKKITFGGNVDLKEEAMRATPALTEIIFNENAEIKGYPNLEGSAYFDNNVVDFVMRGSTLVYYKGNDEVVWIPENVTAIGPSAFENNKTLRTVNITKFVDTLGDKAFKGCSNLETVNFATFGKIKTIGADVFTGTKYYNDFDGDFFTIGTVLIKFRGEGENRVVTIPNTITAITDDCFMDCFYSQDKGGFTWAVSSIFVPASVQKVGEHSFALAKLDDGTYYTPRIYAYDGTDTLSVLRAANIDVTAAPVLADVDGNGQIETEDARRALRLSVHLDYDTVPMYVHAADVDGDHEITAADARRILRLAIELENFTPDELLYMPMTKLEILMYYAKATDIAVRYNVGYTKSVSNAITGSDMCPAASSNFYSTLGKKGASNGTWTYNAKSRDALNNFDACTLMSDRLIDKATCSLGDDGKYTIDIKFKDVLDNYNTSGITKALPAKTRAYFASSYTDKAWWNGTNESNTLTKFDLTYTGCAIHAVVVKKTDKIESSKLTVGYRFNLDGRINGLAISSRMWKTGDATLNRVEETDYSKFIYSPIMDDRQ